jgi:exosortase/archaeosortase
LTIAALVFAYVFGGALFGMFLGTVLPKHHLSPDARDVIKVAMAMIATLAALVLGLLTASAESSLVLMRGIE